MTSNQNFIFEDDFTLAAELGKDVQEDFLLDNFFKRINNVSSYKPMTSLESNKLYNIHMLEETTSNFESTNKKRKRSGDETESSQADKRSVIVHCDDFRTFLPKYHANLHTNELIDILNKKIANNEMKYSFEKWVKLKIMRQC